MHDFLERAALLVVLSFIATIMLLLFDWFFRRRRIKEYLPELEQDESAPDNHEAQPFRWYYIFIFILLVVFAVWLIPIIAGAFLAVCFVIAVFESFRMRRPLLRALRLRGTRSPVLVSCLSAPCLALKRFFRRR